MSPRARAVSPTRRARAKDPVLDYPGYALKVGVKAPSTIRVLQQRLNQVGCGPIATSGVFDRATGEAVRLFQARSVDGQGQSLKIDGVVGPLTWAALFGAHRVPWIAHNPISALMKATLSVASSQVGVMEDPPGSNRGLKVDEYLNAVGIDPSTGSYAWCAAFIYWSFSQAAIQLGTANPAIRTAGVLDHWKKAGQAGITRLLAGQILDDLSLLKPGLVFVINTGGGRGHMGLVEDFRDDRLVTIEGNTNLPGDREGVGVFRRSGRTISDINQGFLSYE
ncbi:MAG: peptidoglycan-binding protein [Nitrospira sp.]|nr:peptidoglycan-binding protein [Nitrospira sp.]